MYISCLSLWDSGITKHAVSCCGSCHDDADEWPEQYGLIEIYEDEIGIPRQFFKAEVAGRVCCAVSHYLCGLPDKETMLRELYEKEAV